MATQRKKIAVTSRQKRKLKIRKQITGSAERPRLSIFRSAKHTYAQLISDDTHKTIASASTLEKEVQAEIAKLLHVPFQRAAFGHQQRAPRQPSIADAHRPQDQRQPEDRADDEDLEVEGRFQSQAGEKTHAGRCLAASGAAAPVAIRLMAAGGR